MEDQTKECKLIDDDREYNDVPGYVSAYRIVYGDKEIGRIIHSSVNKWYIAMIADKGMYGFSGHGDTPIDAVKQAIENGEEYIEKLKDKVIEATCFVDNFDD